MTAPDDANLSAEDRAVARAAEIVAALGVAQERVAAIQAERVRHMKAMRSQGLPWSVIGRAFGVSAQAAMYATGEATRSARR